MPDPILSGAIVLAQHATAYAVASAPIGRDDDRSTAQALAALTQALVLLDVAAVYARIEGAES